MVIYFLKNKIKLYNPFVELKNKKPFFLFLNKVVKSSFSLKARKYFLKNNKIQKIYFHKNKVKVSFYIS